MRRFCPRSCGGFVTPDQERWAFAAKVMEKHGGDVCQHIAEQLQRMFDARNDEGFAFWSDIHARVVQLTAPPTDSKPH